VSKRRITNTQIASHADISMIYQFLTSGEHIHPHNKLVQRHRSIELRSRPPPSSPTTVYQRYKFNTTPSGFRQLLQSHEHSRHTDKHVTRTTTIWQAAVSTGRYGIYDICRLLCRVAPIDTECSRFDRDRRRSWRPASTT